MEKIVIKVDFFTKHVFNKATVKINHQTGVITVFELDTTNLIACYQHYKWFKIV